MIYLFIGIVIIALTNLGVLSVLTRYIVVDAKEEHQGSKKKRPLKKKGQTKAKKRRKR
jgi:hypothetical protein